MSVLKKTALFVVLAAAVVVAQQSDAKVFPPTADQKAEIHKKLAELSARLAALGSKQADPDLLADIHIHKKATEYILRFPEEFFGAQYAAETIKVLDSGIQRALELEAGVPSWPKQDRQRRARLRLAHRWQRAAVRADDSGLLRRQKADAAGRLAPRHAAADERSPVHHAAVGSARDVADPRRGLHHGRAVRPDESLVQVLRRDGRLRSDRGGSQALQHRPRANHHSRPFDGRASGIRRGWRCRIRRFSPRSKRARVIPRPGNTQAAAFRKRV